jgi:AcrR family transcriptional regulator
MSSYEFGKGILDQHFLTDLQERGIITLTFARLDANRQATILTAILEEAALKGPTQINIKEVARRASVSIGSLYQYFNCRQGLLDFSVEFITYRMTAAFKEYTPYLAELPLREALKTYFQGGEAMTRDYRGYIGYFTRAAYQGDPVLVEKVVKPVAAAMLEMTRTILQAARLRGEISREIDFEAMARLVNTLLIAVYDARFLPHLNVYYQLSAPEIPPQRVMDNMLNMIDKALRP